MKVFKLSFLVIYFILSFSLVQTLIREERFTRAKAYFKKGTQTKEVLEKAMAYKKGIRILEQLTQNHDAGIYFLYAEIAKEIAEDRDLSNLLNYREVFLRDGQTSSWYEVARRNYLLAANKDFLNPIYHQRLGLLYAQTGEDQKAEAEFEKAYHLGYNNPMLVLFLSRYYQLRDNDKFCFYVEKLNALYQGMLESELKAEIRDYLKQVSSLCQKE